MKKKKLLNGLLLLSLAFLLSNCTKSIPDQNYDEAWSKVPKILEKIVSPEFPEFEINVIEYGAVGDFKTNSQPAIQKAIDSCAAKGGGRVVIPAGDYLLNGPLHLKSNINLHVSEGATLYFGANPDDYLPVVEVRWEGTRCLNYSPLIYAYEKENIAITGKGTIDGQQQKFWQLWKLIQDKDKVRLRTMGKNLVPLEERVFGKGHFLRPTLIEPYKCKNVLIEGVTVKNSPFWTIHPVFCTNVTIRNVNVQHGQSNDDGCDPESSSYVLIENCTFYTEDDNIAIKAGRDNDAWIENGGKASENIIIRNNTFKKTNAGAITIGSEMSGGVRNIFAENNKIDNAGSVFYIKSNTDRGGVVENLYYRNNNADTCGMILRTRLDYKGADAGEYPAHFKNFYIEDVNVGYAKLGLSIMGLPSKSINHISLKNIKVNAVLKPTEIYFAKNLEMNNVSFISIDANEDEYFEESQGGEENPSRLYWKDVPAIIQNVFLNIFNKKVDTRTEVPQEYRDEVKTAFAEDPMLNGIYKNIINKENVYRLQKFYGWDQIDIEIKENGQIIKSR